MGMNQRDCFRVGEDINHNELYFSSLPFNTHSTQIYLKEEKRRKKEKEMNHTVITEFVLLGLSDDPELQTVIFLFLFTTYVLSVTGNLTIITLTRVDSHLQTPMYFFLRNFSFLEIFTTVCIPRFPGGNYYQRQD